MFPFDIEDEDVELEEKEEESYKEYEINWETGELTGRIVEGLEALKVWIFLTMQTQRYVFEQFTWDYGNELESLIGTSNNQEYMQMEAKRMVKDCLLINEHISDVDDFQCEIIDEKMIVSFTAITDYGEVEINV